jgi:gliding motility-associated-like protein
VGKGTSPNSNKLVSLTINVAANFKTGAIVYPPPPVGENYYTVHASNALKLLAGTAHCNQKDTWITTIANGSLQSFLVTPAGISAAPVISPIGASIQMSNSDFTNIRFSANGEKFVIPDIAQNRMLVYDFNNLTGVFSNEQILRLPAGQNLTDMELSVDGTKLYYSSYVVETDGPDVTGVLLYDIYQLDLEAGNATAIENSKFLMNSYPDRGGCTRNNCYDLNRTLTAAPDGKIYVSMRDVGGLELDKKMNVIEFPNKLKIDASYRRNYIDMGLKYRFINVSYIRSGSFSSKENGIQVKKKLCFGLPSEFSLLFTKIDSVKWEFGDPASGTANYSTDFTPQHTYPAVGLYTVKAIIYKNCLTDTATSIISIDPDPIVHIPAFIKDTIACTGNTLFLDAANPAATSYEWSDGLIYSYREIDKPGDFMVKAYNACSNDQRSFTVTFHECPCDIFTPSAFTPNNDGLNDDFKPLTKCYAKDFQFKVFNRYGNIVFTSSELNKGWNGKYKSIPAPAGVYVWMLQYINPNSKQLMRKQGTVTLIR